jgi:uncharacterized protein
MDAPPEEPVEIPHTDLSPAALRGVIESFVLREGTEYGMHDFTLEQKFDHVLQQLVKRKARILFDPETESVTISTKGQ